MRTIEKSSNMMTEKRSAIVTGASRGIGRAIAIFLAEQGISVIVNCAHDLKSAESVVEEIKTRGGKAAAVLADVSKGSEVARLFNESHKQFGPLDILINNAGYAIRKVLSEFTENEFDNLMNINFKSVFLTIAEASRRMNKGGRIINITASFQGAPIPGYGPYAASKTAIEKLTEIAATELGQREITVNSVRPGPTKTNLFLKDKTPEQISEFEKRTALNRIGKPEDIAKIVLFLVGNDASWITGQTIGANGGYW